MQRSIFNKTALKKHVLFCLGFVLVSASLYSIPCSAEQISKGKYTLNLTANQTKSGSRFIFEIDGDITGPACKIMKLTVNYTNEYANRAFKIFLVENIEDNIPLKFSEFDEVYPTKPNTTWKLDEVYVQCQD